MIAYWLFFHPLIVAHLSGIALVLSHIWYTSTLKDFQIMIFPRKVHLPLSICNISYRCPILFYESALFFLARIKIIVDTNIKRTMSRILTIKRCIFSSDCKSNVDLYHKYMPNYSFVVKVPTPDKDNWLLRSNK